MKTISHSVDTKLVSELDNNLDGLKHHQLATYSWMRKYVIGINMIKFFVAVFGIFWIGGLILSSYGVDTVACSTAVAIMFGQSLYFYHVAIQGALAHNRCYVLLNGVLVLLGTAISLGYGIVAVQGAKERDIPWLPVYHAVIAIPATILAIEVFCCIRMHRLLTPREGACECPFGRRILQTLKGYQVA